MNFLYLLQVNAIPT